MDYDKTPSVDTESNIGSDEDETSRKKPRSSIDDDEDASSETNLRNIWRKRQKLPSNIQTEITNIEQNNSPTPLPNPYTHLKQDLTRSTSTEYDYHSNQKHPHRRPHDHQVPNFAPTYHDDLIMPNRLFNKENFIFKNISLFFSASPFRHLPPKKQSLYTNTHSSSTNDLSAYDHHLRGIKLKLKNKIIRFFYF